jgi:hypothetical protein
MAFGHFKNKAAVLEKFGIRYEEEDFVAPTEFVISQAFLDDFNFVREHIDTRVSESSICENIIYPILKEVYKKYADDFALWSHRTIEYDEELTGMPDYLVATKSELGKVVLGRPLLMIVEAKKNDFEEGWGQCLAEMVMAQKINASPTFTVYGIVSDGDVWEFGKLSENEFTMNGDLFTLSEIQRLFGAVDFVLDSLKQALPITHARS